MVILIAVALAGAGSVTTTQAASFGSCGCAKTGPFVDAKHGVKPTPNPPAGSPFSIATSTAGEPPGITDVKVSSGATQLLEVQTQKWGFSPDNGNRFVTWSVDSGTGVMSVQLYDLTSTTPQSAIWTGGTPSGTSSAAIQFSPTGHFIQLSAISGATDLYLTIRDARTGALKLEDTLTPSSAADTGDDNNVAGWGYGPGDLGFVFAFLNSSSEPQLELVNLANGNVRDIGGVGTSASAFWQFSPCGDVLGVVGDPGGGPLLADMYSLDGTHLGEVSGVTAPVALGATSTELTANGTNVAPNTAGQSCGGGGGSSLVVNFTVSGIRHVGSTITFTDTSTDTTGTINSWSWDFGDGQTSTAENPTHSYTAAGSYTVKLTVKDTAHASSSRQKTVTIGVNKPPKASFTFTPTSASHGDPVTFTDTSTDDVGVTFIQWTINGQVAGDTPGDSLEIQACTTLHVKLTAFDGDGQSNTTPVTTIPVSTAAQITNVAAGGSIADAVAHSCPGDIVNLAPGTYDGGITLGSVSLVGSGEGATVIDNANGATDGWVLTLAPPARNGPLSPAAKPATISDLTVEGGQGGIHVVTEGTSSDITNVEVTNNSSLGGIGIEHPLSSGGCGCPNAPLGPATHIDGDNVHDNGGNQPGLWADFADTVLVTGSEFAHNGGAGVFFGSGGPFQLIDSYSHDNASAGFVASNSDGVSGTVLAVRDRLVDNARGVITNDPLLLAGDLITGSTSGPALDLRQGEDDVSVADSTIAGNDAGGIIEVFPRDFHYPIRLENTILRGNGGPDIEAGIPICRVDGSMIGSLPAFTNDGTYHLAFNSAAIDAGVNARVPAALATDIDSDRRIQGTAVDIGYDETTGTGATTPAGNAFGACQPKYQDFGQGPTIAGSSVSTLTTNTTATATDPLETTVTAPTSVTTGYVTIQELLDFSDQTLTGWTDSVSAFPSGSAADPYSIEFILDKSIVTSGLTTNVMFQGSAVPDCTPHGTTAPDPCVDDVHTASGDVHVTVRSSDPNGIWQFSQS